jgi:CDP-glucose 4,6-dehydratase
MNRIDIDNLKKLNSPILITGHTGFKGTWLSLLLEKFGINSVGYSLEPTSDSLFERMSRSNKIDEEFSDIRNKLKLQSFIHKHRPSVIFHLAAQPLVLDSYKIPAETFEVNVQGTVNLLEAAFTCDSVKVVSIVTTDKVYRNDNSGKKFRETDPLEGKDPYSASKVGAESAATAWRQLSKLSDGPSVLSLRAGNVIGGGDESINRLLPDLMKSFSQEKRAKVRNPKSVRPWQHALDPLFGYVKATNYALNNGIENIFNFGPNSDGLSVRYVSEIAEKEWGNTPGIEYGIGDSPNEQESELLNLENNRAKKSLNWNPRWDQEEAVIRTVKWWKNVLFTKIDPYEACMSDISDFLDY